MCVCVCVCAHVRMCACVCVCVCVCATPEGEVESGYLDLDVQSVIPTGGLSRHSMVEHSLTLLQVEGTDGNITTI